MDNIYGHTYAMLSHMADGDEKSAWEKIVNQPFPKLVGGYIDANKVAIGLFFSGITEQFGLKNGEEWLKAIDCSAQTGWDNTPLSGRYYTHFTIPTEDPQRSEKSRQVMKMQDELHKLGCHAVFYGREVQNDEGKIMRQFGLFLPHMKLPKTPYGTLQRDIDGAAVFLAYLLKNGLVEEAEIPRDVDDDGNRTKNAAFTTVILRLAKSADVQAKFSGEVNSPSR